MGAEEKFGFGRKVKGDEAVERRKTYIERREEAEEERRLGFESE